MSVLQIVTQEDIEELLEIFKKKSYEAGPCEPGTKENDIIGKCEQLLKLDYTLVELDNREGCLSSNYPSRIFIPDLELHSNGCLENVNALNNDGCDDKRRRQKEFLSVMKYMTASRYGRCRQRFAVPVILINGKYICRSATISAAPEAYGRKVINYAYECIASTSNTSKTTDFNSYSTATISNDSVIITPTSSAISTVEINPKTNISSTQSDNNENNFNNNNNNNNNDLTSVNETIKMYEFDCMPSNEDAGNIDNADLDVDIDMKEFCVETVDDTFSFPFSYSDTIQTDIKLLRKLNITTIVDLMVEQRKVKYFVAVTSSEKADSENQYSNFNLMSLPYPGCEFFSKFSDNNYMAKNLYYDWMQSFNDAKINVPKTPDLENLCNGGERIDWANYQNWDLVLMTQNYIKCILKHVQLPHRHLYNNCIDSKCGVTFNRYNPTKKCPRNGGILIHCISGWDRTPLFVSLIRLSLWADGLIHQSLSAIEITYLTLAYDWYLFGHQLPDRLVNNEEIMFFCFHVLKHITDDEYGLYEIGKRSSDSTASSTSSESSVIILKENASDEATSSSKEDSSSLVQNLDQDSNDFCDTSSFENLCSSSSNSKRSKTSPISVPGLSTCRERSDSSSSSNSWQVVTETGSIDSSKLNGNNDLKLNDDDQIKSGAKTTENDKNGVLLPTHMMLRKQRLTAVRTVFIQAYGKAGAFKFKEGTTQLKNLFGTLADQLF